MDKSTLEAMCTEGLSTRGIASKMKVSQCKVRHWLKKHGLKTSYTGHRKAWDSYSVTDTDFVHSVANNKTVADVLRELGIPEQQGATYKVFWNKVKSLNLSTRHFDRYSNNIGSRRYTDAEVYTKDSAYKGNKTLKRRALKDGVLTNQCIECGLIPKWNGKELVLHLDHINGDKRDNRVTNLRILCPNCHSQTPTYCGRNNK